MATATVEYPDYNRQRGVIAGDSHGEVTVRRDGSSVAIIADADGLRDLARWCLALADAAAPDGSHVHLDPGVDCLADASLPLLISKEKS